MSRYANKDNIEDILLDESDDEILDYTENLKIDDILNEDDSSDLLDKVEILNPYSLAENIVAYSSINGTNTRGQDSPDFEFVGGEISGNEHLSDELNVLNQSNAITFMALHEDDLSSLEQAEKREQRFLSLGNREIISVLKSTTFVSKEEIETSSIQFEILTTISYQLRRNAEYKQHGPGVACIIHSNHKFFAVGTSRGYVLIFDLNQEIRQVLSLGSQHAAGLNQNIPAVTAIDSTPGGTFLVSGNSSGEIILWDVLKGLPLKVVSDLHNSKISWLTFSRDLVDNLKYKIRGTEGDNFSDDKLTDFMVVSIDCKGVSYRIRFNKHLWSFTCDKDCLLDGKMGVIQEAKSAKPIKEFSFHSALISDIGLFDIMIPINSRFAAICSNGKTYIIQLWPIVRVMHKWIINSDSEWSEDNPVCVDWGWTVDLKSQQIALVLICGCGCVVETLRIKKQNSSEKDTRESLGLYTFEVDKSISLDSRIVNVRYVSDCQVTVVTRSNVVLMNENLDIIDVCTFPTQMKSLESDFFSLSDLPHFLSFSGAGQSLFVLSQNNLFKLFAQVWIEKLETYITQGKWLEGLSLIQKNYSSLNSSPHENCDYFKSYLCRYLYLTMIDNSSTLVVSSNHYSLVASVCLELCVSVDRLDVLFGLVYESFSARNQKLTFLNVLEPYILNRKVKYLPPNVFADLLSYMKLANRLSSLSRIIAYLDVDRLDLNLVSVFLLENQLFSTFLYAFGFGSHDLSEAFQIVLDKLVSELNYLEVLKSIWSPNPLQTDMCYKLILFVKYSVEGYVYPRKEPISIPFDWLAKLLHIVSAKRYLEPSILRSTKSSCSLEYVCMTLLTTVDSYATVYYICQLIKSIQYNPISEVQSELVSNSYYNIWEFVSRTSKVSVLYESLLKTFYLISYRQICECRHYLHADVLVDLVLHLKNSISDHCSSENMVILMSNNQLRHTSSHSEIELGKLCTVLIENGYFRALLLWNESQSLVIFSRGIAFYLKIGKTYKSAANEVNAISDSIIQYLNSINSICDSNIKRGFESTLIENMVKFYEINVEMAKHICCQYLIAQYTCVYDALGIYSQIQFELCSSMIKSVIEDSTKNLALYFTQIDILNYIKILLKFETQQVVSFVKNQDHFPLDEAITLCKNQGVLDAAGILLEKTGNLNDALDLLLSNLANRFSSARMLVDDVLKQSTLNMLDRSDLRASFHMVLYSKDNSQTDILKKYSFYRQLNTDIEEIAQLCKQASSKSGNGDAWFKGFDFIVNERKKYGLMMTSTGVILCAIVSNLIQLFLVDMKDYVPSHEIVKRVTQIYSGSKYAEFKSIINSMIRVHQYEHQILSCVRKIHLLERSELLTQKFKFKKKGHLLKPDMISNDADMPRVKTNTNTPRLFGLKAKISKFKMSLRRTECTTLVLRPPPLVLDTPTINRFPGTLPLKASYENSYECGAIDFDSNE